MLYIFGFFAVLGLAALSFLPSLPLAFVLLLRIVAALVFLFFYLRSLFLNNRFFYALGLLFFMYVAAFPFPELLPLAHLASLLLLLLLGLDCFLLYNGAVRIEATRKLANLLSLGDSNAVHLHIQSHYALPLQLRILDELPAQLQQRNFVRFISLPGRSEQHLRYAIVPKTRGIYKFGKLHLFLSSSLGLAERRYSFDIEEETAVYPSLIQMKQYELLALSRISTQVGVKKVRRLGHSYEFEQIREYVKGDDYRSINWKATGRRGGKMMVNQYEDERSQQIFSVIDKSRSMKMPFNGLSLMDYAINSTLVISNVALQKHDRAGYLSFSDSIGSAIRADSGAHQLRRILQALYKEQEHEGDSDFELLYTATRRFINRRSLLFLYTNFESLSAMRRVLPILRRINRLHLLVLVFFENDEIVDYSNRTANNTEEIYYATIARQFVEEKYRIVQELRRYGIQSILTSPEELSMKSVNKYLELKARGMI